MKKVLFIQNIVYPLRNPLFEKIYNEKIIAPFILFLSENASNRKWNIKKSSLSFPHLISKNLRVSFFNTVHDLIINPHIVFEYIRIKHDVLISIGWANPSNYILCLFSYLRKIPYYLWVESTIYENSLQRSIMFPFIKILVKYSSGCIVPGSASKKYIKQFDQSKNILIIPNAIENSRIVKKRQFNKVPILLFVGRFSKEKNLIFFLKTIKKIENNFQFLVWFIGHGPEISEIKNFIRIKNIKSVQKIEYLNYDDIAKVYSKSDIFILPSSQEPWGFVVNEAMACGLPIISSDRVGSSFELVKDGYNGFVFENNDSIDLENKIVTLLKSRALRKRMGKNSLKLIKNISYDNMCSILYENI